ncbi:MAG: ABC transporter permease [Pseudomonadota bacterium]|nr:ABC transporter permease [Pseudomonadota bacterium]QKK04560.1 MAG: ABC transporter permease [Pseudomonadota bacterium]
MTAKQTETAAPNPKKIPVYPENLMPVANDPRVLSPAPRMAGFVLLIFLIAGLWQHVHISVVEKQDRLSGIYTLAFFKSEQDTRTPQEQADEALDTLRNIPGILKAALLDARSIPAFQETDAKTALPALVQIKIAASGETVFLQKMSELAEHFPAAQLRDHSHDTQVTALKTRYARFLMILNISAVIAAALIVAAMLAAAPKWLRPQQETIALLRVLGAEDKMILYVFSRHTLRNILKGLTMGAALVAGLFLIPAYLLGLFGLLPAAVKIDPVMLGLILAFGLGLLYIAARLRTKNILRQQIWNAA